MSFQKENIEILVKKDNVEYDFSYITFTGIIVRNTHIEYRKNGILHRENNEPAVVYFDNTKIYCKNGKTHREDGPAIIYFDKKKEYYINDTQVTKKEQEFYYDLMKLRNI